MLFNRLIPSSLVLNASGAHLRKYSSFPAPDRKRQLHTNEQLAIKMINTKASQSTLVEVLRRHTSPVRPAAHLKHGFVRLDLARVARVGARRARVVHDVVRPVAEQERGFLR